MSEKQPTNEQIELAVAMSGSQGYVLGECDACGEESGPIEPDAEDYDCEACGAVGTVTSPLRRAGLI